MDRRKKILIVDDEPLYIDILVDLLSDDYDTVVATSGEQALKRALDKPDLILLDVLMPEMDGYEVCQRLKREKRSCDAPVIFLTIKGELDDEIRGFEVGAVDYISKPMSPSIVKARVATHLQLSEVRKQLSQENIALLTEQRKKEIELRRKEKMAAVGALTSGIAHDFNNVLGAIIGYAELLPLHLHDENKLVKYATQIQAASERGSHIIKKLLVYSQQESTHESSVDINGLLKEDQNMLGRSLTPSIKLVLKPGEELWPVYVDKSDLQDAILNISINAMHAMPEGGELTLKTHNEHLSLESARDLGIPAGAYVELSIVDTGIGMDKSTQEKIFDPFFTTKGDEGTGLGLSQVYRFVEKSGGAVDVSSKLKHGAQITLYFPRHIGGETEPKKHIDYKPVADYFGKETILLVDDEKALRDLFSEYLSGQGYEVLCAKNANVALQLLQTNSVHLMLCDVVMQGMNGYKLAEMVQQQYPATKIQMISGYTASKHEYLTDSDLHMQRLQKPVHLITVAKRIRELLD